MEQLKKMLRIIIVFSWISLYISRNNLIYRYVFLILAIASMVVYYLLEYKAKSRAENTIKKSLKSNTTTVNYNGEKEFEIELNTFKILSTGGGDGVSYIYTCMNEHGREKTFAAFLKDSKDIHSLQRYKSIMVKGDMVDLGDHMHIYNASVIKKDGFVNTSE